MDSSRERDPYRDTDDYVEDMTEETLGQREQSRQSMQAQQQDGQRERLDDDFYEDQDDLDDLQ
ncbi:hypothetical protein [Streptomyces hesseae]|uniref:DUF5709 domain-containing protein n=1 Tax=Streptomyces hesseae TaxID=3075519 RepID=A0ABU2SL16_9ACTN|nr:hypothetical protein [Streptomyces sp. DSM 40473]MDT0449587.1 hypothetical protein [Streptomyces sp. DSM 40473]